MKKVIYLLGFMLLFAGVAKAQNGKVPMGPEIEFEKVVHDYGDVPYNGNGECEFRFNRPGIINKTVTVTSNAVKNSTVVLRIKGRVLDQPSEALPEKKSNFSVGSPVNNN